MVVVTTIARLIWVVLRVVLVLLVVAVALVVSSGIVIPEAIIIIASVAVRALFFRRIRILGVAIVLVLMDLRRSVVVVLPWRSIVLSSRIVGHCDGGHRIRTWLQRGANFWVEAATC